jgi:hypothetical protein
MRRDCWKSLLHGLGCLRERHPGWTDGSLEHCLSRDEGGGSPTSVAPRDENGVCMYYAPVKPSAHIGVMQLSKIHPKNDKQPHPIESPNGTKSQGRGVLSSRALQSSVRARFCRLKLLHLAFRSRFPVMATSGASVEVSFFEADPIYRHVPTHGECNGSATSKTRSQVTDDPSIATSK